MATKKRVFISFDFDHDEGTKIMLAGQAKKPDSPFDFKDASVKDHLTGDWINEWTWPNLKRLIG